MTIKVSALGLLALTTPSLARVVKRQSSAASYVTSSDGTYNLGSYTAPVSGAGSTTISSTWNLTVDDTSSGHKQSITGFGAAVTDATVQVFNSLPSDQLSALLQDILTTNGDSGAGMSLFRHTIGASDLSASEYTYDDSSSPDTSLSNFGLTNTGSAMASLIAQFSSVNSGITLLGSVWSPPGWMKLNGVVDGNTDNNNLNTAYADQYASYFVKYIQAFASAGVTVDAITIQNEPLNSQAGYPTMYVAADQSAQLIQNNVGPALQSAGLKTQIWAYDHNTDQPDYPQTVLSGASDYVNTVAWHCYANPLDWTVLSTFHQSNPGVAQYMTECWTSPTNGWSQVADFVLGPMQNYASGAMAWTLGSDTSYGPHLAGGCSTCRGLVEVDTSAGTYSLTIDYYIMAQFSRFVGKGATALNTTGSYDYGNGQKIEAQAFLNSDGSRVLVVENGFDNDVYLTTTFGSGDQWSGPLYAQSVTTWTLPSN